MTSTRTLQCNCCASDETSVQSEIFPIPLELLSAPMLHNRPFYVAVQVLINGTNIFCGSSVFASIVQLARLCDVLDGQHYPPLQLLLALACSQHLLLPYYRSAICTSATLCAWYFRPVVRLTRFDTCCSGVACLCVGMKLHTTSSTHALSTLLLCVCSDPWRL